VKTRGNLKKNPGELFWWKDKRRRQTNGTSMLQKAMELKQKKKLEPLKCNSFVALHADSLAKDMNLKFGIDTSDANNIIDNMIAEEKRNINKFVDVNSLSVVDNQVKDYTHA
jgi:hypothetical protein